MDRNEQDWDRLGKELRDYQPAGDPEADFAAFLDLQQRRGTPHRRWLAWLGLGLAVLLTGSTWFLLPEEDSALATTVPTPRQEFAARGTTGQKPVPARRSPSSVTAAESEMSSTGRDIIRTEEQSEIPVFVTDLPEKVIGVGESQIGGHQTGIGTAVTADDPDDKARIPATRPAPKKNANGAAEAITPLPSPRYTIRSQPPPPAPAALPAAAPIIPVSARKPVIVFGTGLSSHWRGSRFLEDVDNGVYFSVGVEKRFGRLSVDGRAGYRGHGLNLVVDEGTVDPWSHYEDKTNAIDDSGEEIEYTYVGIVEGYKGLEFSLLAGYQFNHRLRLQAGGRYSLPSLSFRRTVHSSHNEDVTYDPNPYHLFVTEQPLVRYYDYGALFGGQYRLGKALSVEAMLHLGMVDLIEDEGERQRRFNHSSSVSVGIRYRLQ